jgi:2-succinyl-5-enolpyruvyl-6-hydroxy-3-cyclohexene-1-carboxylate synthase
VRICYKDPKPDTLLSLLVAATHLIEHLEEVDKLCCNNAGKTRDLDLVWSHSEAYVSVWENRSLRSIDTYRSCTKGLQKTAYLHLGNCNVKYIKAMKG